MRVQISSVIREKAAEAAEIVNGQLKAASNTKPVSTVAVGTADVLATKRVRSNELVDSLSSMLEYPHNRVGSRYATKLFYFKHAMRYHCLNTLGTLSFRNPHRMGSN
jgi:hypothetical protein